MTTTDSCSYNTPGSINGWHSPETATSYHNGAISKNTYYNGFQEKDYKSERDDDKYSRSPKNINLTNGLKNININNGVIPKKKCSRENSIERDMINGRDNKGNADILMYALKTILIDTFYFCINYFHLNFSLM